MTRAYIHSHTSSDPLKSLEVARDWGRRFADPLTRNAKPFPPRDRNPRKKLKVGYVTADFRQHSVAFFMRPVLEHHNPDNVEIHVYSSGRPDKMTEKLRALVPHWHDAVEQTDDQLYEQICADGIDVLVDLSGLHPGPPPGSLRPPRRTRAGDLAGLYAYAGDEGHGLPVAGWRHCTTQPCAVLLRKPVPAALHG